MPSSKKTQKIKKNTQKIKKKTLKGKKRKKVKIIDVPLSENISQGSFESMGEKNYHYQAYNMIFLYFNKLLNKNKNLQNLLCFPKKKEDWMNSFFKLNLNDDDLKTSELLIQNISFLDPNANLNKIIDLVKTCQNKKKRFFMLSVALVVPGKPGTHANMVVIDLKKKTSELFEPHAKRTEQSTLDSLVGAYKISDDLLRDLFKKILPDFKYISSQDYLPTWGLQGKTDAYGGLCVTWTAMYLHYRILNPNSSREEIIKHLNNLNQNFLLKYVKHIEETIKFEKTIE